MIAYQSPPSIKMIVILASFISCRKYFTLSGTDYQENWHCVQESV
ncbi:hypothetical protein MTBBW1_830019 [Desulfamplus magnetovallimortis]|uniref:Uncharacterized protein n=1 Tax=Desulfamplus magnetovallimortis TaxID=1246637 RepID=A0A1W1HKA0_9BACT|nr:hypothetical protein MTBBW1_830019 [Desulfamplus magnetovallimortis]